MTLPTPAHAAGSMEAVWPRVRIQGMLTLQTPLVIKTGTSRPGVPTKQGDIPDVMQVLRTRSGCAVIPGSSLKGILRSAMESQRYGVWPEDVINKLFGRESTPKVDGDASPDSGCGGAVEFGFSLSTSPIPDPNAHLEQIVAIDRVRRAAADRLLFAVETVPAGTCFQVTLLGYKLMPRHLAALVATLRRFNDEQYPLRLGSSTASDYGRAAWSDESVQTLTTDQLQQWTATPADRDLPDVWSLAGTYTSPPAAALARASVLRFEVALSMEGWFLVRDPRQPNSDADAQPRQIDIDGKYHVIVPARSVRGVLRSQVERIARTLAPATSGPPGPLQGRPDSAKSLVEALFGSVGGRTALAISTFVDERPSEAIKIDDHAIRQFALPTINTETTSLWKREFVAIDRFTGGAAEHLKYNCRAAWQPQLTGTLTIDLSALARRCEASSPQSSEQIAPAAVLGLFFLALRDLYEGDLSFGMGAAKGFGQTQTVTITTSVDDFSAAQLEAWIGESLAGVRRPTETIPLFHDRGDPWFRTLAQHCVTHARRQLQDHLTGAPS